MKKMLTLTLIVLSAVSFGQKKAILTGQIANPTGDWVYLRTWDKSERMWNSILMDSCELKNGQFELSTSLDSLTNIEFFDGNEATQLYMKPGEKLNLSLNTQFFDETLVFSGDGSGRNNLMAQVAIVSETMTHYRNVMYGMFELDPKMDTIPLFENLANNDSLFEAYVDFEMSANPEMEGYLMDSKQMNKNISSSYVRKANKHLVFNKMLKEEAGAQFLDATGVNLDGKKVKVSDFYGKITVLDFWATWCGPCKAEFPGLHELEEKYDGQVTFLGIASFCKKEDWEKMAKEEGFHNSIYIEKDDMEPVSSKYAIQTIPRYIILDAKGTVINLEAQRPSTGLENQLIELLK